jgi:hypothetical protein
MPGVGEAALQISGYQNAGLAVVLAALVVLLAGVSLWSYLRARSTPRPQPPTHRPHWVQLQPAPTATFPAATRPTEREREVSDAHRKQLQALAAAYTHSVRIWRNTRGKQHEDLEGSFWAHFPDVGAQLDKWDDVLATYEDARRALSEWLLRESEDVRVAELPLRRAVESDSDLKWSVNGEQLWLDGGWGIAPVSDDTDIEVLKRPYEQLVARAKKAPVGAKLRTAWSDARAAQDAALRALQRIQLLHVIRGKCALC